MAGVIEAIRRPSARLSAGFRLTRPCRFTFTSLSLRSTLIRMPATVSGQVTAFFLYDAAEVIDLSKVATLIGGTSRVRLTTKTTTPSYVQYQQPPLTVEGGALGLADALGFSVGFK